MTRLLAATILATLLAAAPAAASGVPVTVGGPDGRRALDGTWVVRLDPAGRGRALGYPAGRFAGRAVQVPFSPNARDVTRLESYRGSIAWYRTDVSLAGGDYAIRFESVNHRARVWVDGREVARHTGNYLPFEARLPLAAGRHRLVVRADWRSPERMRRDGWFRSWFNFGGINREVTVRRLGRSELDAPGIVTRLQGGTPVVTVSVRVRNRAEARAVTVAGRLGDTALRFRAVRLAPGRAAWVSARVRLPRARLWWPRRAALQTLRLAVPHETGYVARVGLRELTWHRGRLFVNGHRLQVEGASIQEDAAGHGDALTPADMDAIVERLRRIGANATRAQHGLHPALLERLDAAGILVWQGAGPFDVPGRWAARTPAARRLALRRVRLDVLNARAHPSVLAWNLANEIAYDGASDGQRDHIVRAARLARRLDPGRPIALDAWGTHLPARAGRIHRAVDAIGVTNYEGWYANPGSPRSARLATNRAWLKRVHALFKDKVLVVSEFGAETHERNPSALPGGVGYQARVLADHIRAYQADRKLSGMIVWSLQDFALRPNFLGGSVRSLLPAIVLQRGINAKGLFTYGGSPKPAADVVRRLYTSGREPS